MAALIAILLEQRRALYLVLVLIMVLGVFAFYKLPSDVYPELSFPRIAVIASVGDISPERVLMSATRVLEEAASQVYGVRWIRSKTIRGATELSVEFQTGTDMIFAWQQLQARLAEVRSHLPPTTSLIVEPVTPAIFPVLNYNVSSDIVPESDLYYLMRYQVEPRLTQVPGVARVITQAGKIPEIAVQVDPAKLKSYAISISDVANALAKTNQVQVIGRVDDRYQQNLIVGPGEAHTPQELYGVIVSSGTKGEPVFLKDLAEISYGYQDPMRIISVDGKEGIVLNIFRQPNSNVIAVASGIAEELASLKSTLPKGIEIKRAYDESNLVKDAIASILDEIVIGIVLIVIILFAFLRSWKSTVIAALTIPLCAAASFGFMALLHQSLNLMSLGGLAIALGLVIDDAIVIIENIHRQLAKGLTPNAAAITAVSELAGPVTSSTATTLVVFLPLGLLSGVPGQFFSALTVTLASAVAFSLFLALMVMPIMCAQWMRRSKRTVGGDGVVKHTRDGTGAMGDEANLEDALQPDGPNSTVENSGSWDHATKHRAEGEALGEAGRDDFQSTVNNDESASNNPELSQPQDISNLQKTSRPGVFAGLLRALLRHPLLGSLGVIPILAGTIILFDRVGMDFLPEIDEGNYVLDYFMPTGTSLSQTDNVCKRIEKVLASTPEVTSWTRRTGAELGLFATEPNTGDILVVLKPHNQRTRSTSEVMDEQRKRIADSITEVEVEFHPILADQLNDLVGTRSPIEIRVFGEDPHLIRSVAERIETTIQSVPGLVDVAIPSQAGAPEFDVRVDPWRAGRLFLTPLDVTDQIKDSLLGRVSTQIKQGDKFVDVRVRLTDKIRLDEDQISNLTIHGKNGAMLPLSAIADIKQVRGESEIHRENQQRYVSVEASVEKRDLGSAIEEVRVALSKINAPKGTSLSIGGLHSSQKESFTQLLLVLVLAITLVYLMMLIQFRSLAQPLAILSMSPLSLLGVEAALVWTGTPLNISSFMGVILLVGLGVKNGIILLEYSNRLRAGGMSIEESLIEAGQIRLRPILMTTLCTILALMPLALGRGPGAELHRPLAITVIGGLSISTLTTLLFVPIIDLLLCRLNIKSRRHPQND